jgi:heme-degrading monooxygenase HmoA
MSDGVTITFEMKLKPEVVPIFPQMGPQILASPSQFPGFRSLRIVQNKDDPARILYIEKWDTEADYKAYIAERTRGGEMGKLAEMVTATDMNVWPTLIGEIAR